MGWNPYEVPEPVATGDCYHCDKTTEATPESDSICSECELIYTDDPNEIIEYLVEENDKKEKRLLERIAQLESELKLAVLKEKLDRFGEDIKAEIERIANLPKIRGRK